MVVVGDDDLDAFGLKLCNLLQVADAAVHRHEQVGAFGVLCDAVRRDTVAVREAIGDKGRDVAAQGSQP